MAKRTAAAQKAYRDRLRGRPPKPYGIKPSVEQAAYTIPVQYLINVAYRQSTATWNEPTPLGNMPIQIDPAFLRNDEYCHPPTWICLGGLRFELRRWEVLDGKLDRFAVVDEGNGQGFTKIYVLGDGRFGTRFGLGMIYKTQNLSKKTRRLKTRQKLIEKLEGGKREIDYVKTLPVDYIPARRKNKRSGQTGLLMRKGKYHRLKLRLLHPELRYYGKRARAMRRKGGIVLVGV